MPIATIPHPMGSEYQIALPELTSTDAAQTIDDYFKSVLTNSANIGTKKLHHGYIKVTSNAVRLNFSGGSATFASSVSTTLAASAATDGGEVALLSGKTANTVVLPIASTTGLVAGQYVVIAGTTNYDGTHLIESLVAATSITIRSAFTAETFTTDDTVVTANSGILVESGEIFHLTDENDIDTLSFSSAASGDAAKLSIILKY
jgi:hypothetical protein